VNWTPAIHDLDLATIKGRYDLALGRLDPALIEAGDRLFRRIATDNWALEWSLPRWLGTALGLPPEQTQALILSNVLGLAYVRLQDDVVDGEVDPAIRDKATLLGTALHQQWIARYVPLFDRASPFWDHLETYVGQWLRATLAGNHPDPVRFSIDCQEDLLRLAERGAPLKLCVVAACLLADRGELVAGLAAAVDHLLAAAVLLDHAGDWARDLEAGRFNAFVAYAQTASDRAGRGGVVAEIYAGRSGRPYFALARRQVQIAREKSRVAGIPGLARYLDWLEGEVVRSGQALATTARRRVRAATEQLVWKGGDRDGNPSRIGKVDRQGTDRRELSLSTVE
jgi:hypothetical protein